MACEILEVVVKLASRRETPPLNCERPASKQMRQLHRDGARQGVARCCVSPNAGVDHTRSRYGCSIVAVKCEAMRCTVTRCDESEALSQSRQACYSTAINSHSSGSWVFFFSRHVVIDSYAVIRRLADSSETKQDEADRQSAGRSVAIQV